MNILLESWFENIFSKYVLCEGKSVKVLMTYVQVFCLPISCLVSNLGILFVVNIFSSFVAFHILHLNPWCIFKLFTVIVFNKE